MSKIAYMVGTLLQREINVYAPNCKILEPSWKSNTTPAVTLFSCILLNFQIPDNKN